jgi:hypothetical protein
VSVLTVTEVEAGPRKGLEIEIATKRGVAEAEVAAQNAIAGRTRTKLALEQGQDRMRAKTETQKM